MKPYKASLTRPEEVSIDDEFSPKEPRLQARLEEIGTYLLQIEDVLHSMRGLLFGEGEAEAKAASKPNSIDGVVQDLSRRAACLSGEAKSIFQRL